MGNRLSQVFLGSAIKDTAGQSLLDGVCAYLASPAEREVLVHDTTLPTSTPQVKLVPAAAAPLVAPAFKLEEERFGQLTYVTPSDIPKHSSSSRCRAGSKAHLGPHIRNGRYVDTLTCGSHDPQYSGSSSPISVVSDASACDGQWGVPLPLCIRNLLVYPLISSLPGMYMPRYSQHCFCNSLIFDWLAHDYFVGSVLVYALLEDNMSLGFT